MDTDTYVYSDLDFYLDEESAKEVGIIMQSEPLISAIEPNIETIEIPGRSGAVHIMDGTYKERTIDISCYAVGYAINRDDGYYADDGIYHTMEMINRFLFPQTTAIRKLKIGYSDTYYKAIILNAAEIQARLKTLNPFNIQFSVYPIRLRESDDSEVGL